MDTDSAKQRILLCEDDLNLSRLMRSLFEANGYSVTVEQEGRLGFVSFQRGNFDLCILDVMMPGMDGFSLAQKIREIDAAVPIFFLTAKNMKEDFDRGYKVGADDYITKPVDMDILLMKINAVCRRKQRTGSEEVEQNDALVMGNYTYKVSCRELSFRGKLECRLSPTESKLLVLLYESRADILDREVALKKVWKASSYFSSRSMDVYITRLRKYLSKDSRVKIVNLYSTGFKLVVPE